MSCRLCFAFLIALLAWPSFGAEVSPQLRFGTALDCSLVYRTPEVTPGFGVDQSDLYGRMRSQCRASHPKNWNSEEVKRINSVLSDLNQSQLQGFFQTLNAVSITRATALYEQQPSGEMVRSKALAVFNRYANSVVLFDETFLKDQEARARNEGFDFRSPDKDLAHMLLHELAHAYSEKMGDLANDCEFLKVTGWNEKDGKSWIRQYSGEEVVSSFNELLQRLESGCDRRPVIAENHRRGRERGFPTLYAMTNPTEMFAELLSYIVLDPDSRSYIDPKILKWFEDNVFNSQRKSLACPARPM